MDCLTHHLLLIFKETEVGLLQYDSSERGSEDNVGDKDFDFSGILEDFTESDSNSETNLDICSEKNSKIRRYHRFKNLHGSDFSRKFFCDITHEK